MGIEIQLLILCSILLLVASLSLMFFTLKQSKGIYGSFHKKMDELDFKTESLRNEIKELKHPLKTSDSLSLT